MSNLFKENMALTANDLNSLAVQSEVTAALAQKAKVSDSLSGYGIVNGVSNDFTDTSGAKNYIGKNISTLPINSGTHVFTNCTGTINYSGTTAKVYINNSPGLTISKSPENWARIYIDGKRSFTTSSPSVFSQISRGFVTGGSASQYPMTESNISYLRAQITADEFGAVHGVIAIGVKNIAPLGSGSELTYFSLKPLSDRMGGLGLHDPGIAMTSVYNGIKGVQQIYNQFEIGIGLAAIDFRSKTVTISF